MTVFKKFKLAVDEQVKRLYELSEGSRIFRTSADPDQLWELYLSSFPEGTNEIYRERREHDCQECRRFIKQFGNVVVIKDDLTIESVWNLSTNVGPTYTPVIKAMARFVNRKAIADIFLTTEKHIGVDSNIDRYETKRWFHLAARNLPRNAIASEARIGELRNEARTGCDVLKRAFDELTPYALDTVSDLLDENNLHNGASYKKAFKDFVKAYNQYKKLSGAKAQRFVWRAVTVLPPSVIRMRSTALGTLLVDLSEDVDLMDAVVKYTKKVDPANFKQPKRVYPKSQVNAAKKLVKELGFEESLQRRLAKVSDISPRDILYVNADTIRAMMPDDVFSMLEKDAERNAPVTKVEGATPIKMDSFVKAILPDCTKVELLLENRLAANMVSLVTAQNPNSPSMFSWENSFGWAYSGNMASSSLAQNVAKAGGKIDGVLRFSLQWNEGNDNKDDLDAHLIETNGRSKYEIYFGNRERTSPNGGNLDVDITHPKDEPAVENIVYSSLARIRPGEYLFRVKRYDDRRGKGGFRAEIAMGDNIYQYNCPSYSTFTSVATVTVDAAKKMTIKHHLKATELKRDVWGLTTGQFQEVSTVMYSPNFWETAQKVGNQHLFFMLKGCKTDESPSGFFNEYLKQELVQKHKRVFAALGGMMKTKESPDDQLSGVGFNVTQRNHVTVKATTAEYSRVFKVKF